MVSLEFPLPLKERDCIGDYAENWSRLASKAPVSLFWIVVWSLSTSILD